MTDPNYAHEFNPNRQGLCKEIIGGRKLGYSHCGDPKEALVHVRWAAQNEAQPGNALVCGALLNAGDRRALANMVAEKIHLSHYVVPDHATHSGGTEVENCRLTGHELTDLIVDAVNEFFGDEP